MNARPDPGAPVADVELIPPSAPQFSAHVEALWGRPPDAVLSPALPFSVVACNHAGRPVALLGVRFDMEPRHGKPYSVVHYADTLRNPANADFQPGAMRFVCAEPAYTNLVLRRESAVDRRGPMNLENLAKTKSVRASIDCVAFADGHFHGPDTLGAFDRLAAERVAEIELAASILAGARSEADMARLLEEAIARPLSRALARQLYTELVAGGLAAATENARRHRPRIALTRYSAA